MKTFWGSSMVERPAVNRQPPVETSEWNWVNCGKP